MRRRVRAGDVRREPNGLGTDGSANRVSACAARDGWLRVLCTTVQIGQDWFDEDHIVVDCEGRIIVQSRQLAMVPADA